MRPSESLAGPLGGREISEKNYRTMWRQRCSESRPTQTTRTNLQNTKMASMIGGEATESEPRLPEEDRLRREQGSSHETLREARSFRRVVLSS
jgi:hypothetical protein